MFISIPGVQIYISCKILLLFWVLIVSSCLSNVKEVNNCHLWNFNSCFLGRQVVKTVGLRQGQQTTIFAAIGSLLVLFYSLEDWRKQTKIFVYTELKDKGVRACKGCKRACKGQESSRKGPERNCNGRESVPRVHENASPPTLESACRGREKACCVQAVGVLLHYVKMVAEDVWVVVGAVWVPLQGVNY